MTRRAWWGFAAAVIVAAGLWAPGIPRPSWLQSMLGAGTSAMAPAGQPSSDQPKPAASGGQRVLPPAPVLTAIVKQQTLPVRLEGIGNVQARSTIAIKSRVDGQLMEAAVKEGQQVKKGDLLFRIDPRSFEAQLRQAQANLTRDIANYEKARADYARSSDLVDKGFTARSKFDDAKAALAALEATIKADQAAVEVAKLSVDYTIIRSPIDGQVGNILLTPGNMIKANDTQALIVITEIDPIYVAFAVPEQYLSRVRARLAQGELKVDVWPPEEKGRPVTGELFFVNNAVDYATGTIMLMAKFDNKDQRLTAGQFVQASANLATMENILSVPVRTVQVGQKGMFVYVVKADKTVELRPVVTGPTVDDVIVITKGVEKGETIVIEGQLRLYPGARVIPKDAASAANKPKEQS